MYKKAIAAVSTLVLVTMLTSATVNSETKKAIGIVNFKTCLDGSKHGKEEQARFDAMKKQMETAIEEKEKALNELAPKFNEEYLDTLTPEAEAELKQKFQALSNDLSQQQNQYYHLLNQANYQILQKLHDAVADAAKKVALQKGLDMVMNEEACFYYAESYDISKEVVALMDIEFAKIKPAETKK